MSHATTTCLTPPVATETMMKIEIEPFEQNEIRMDVSHGSGKSIGIEQPRQRPAMVPVESPMAMRRQPTPQLIAPLRWSGWSVLTQVMTNLVRRSRFKLGYERD